MLPHREQTYRSNLLSQPVMVYFYEGPTIPSTDPIAPYTWQGHDQNANVRPQEALCWGTNPRPPCPALEAGAYMIITRPSQGVPASGMCVVQTYPQATSFFSLCCLHSQQQAECISRTAQLNYTFCHTETEVSY